MYRPATILGSLVALVAAVGLLFTGDVQGKLMFEQQPMKMASAESLCHTETDPDFSILTVGTHNNCDSITRVIEVPYVLPFLAESKFCGVTLAGRRGPAAARPRRSSARVTTGPTCSSPTGRSASMIGLLLVPVAFALLSLWLTRRGRIPDQRWFGVVRAAHHSDTVPGQLRRAGSSPRWAVSPGWWCPTRPATRWCE